MNYYNEFDPFAAEWLKELIKEGLIPNGDVDTRSIADVSPRDIRSYAQCHFFAGIGGWSHALRLAGWPDDKQIWTGSCPCQPFSVAGKGKGKSDERHLWPVFFQLISECRPPVVMGEQVAGKAGYDWFDGVASDLEREGYASRAVDIPACAVDAPHIRQRLYWIASNLENTTSNGCQQRRNAESTQIQRKCPKRGRQLAPSRADGELQGGIEGFYRTPLSGALGNAHGAEREARDVFGSGTETRPECSAQSGLQHGSVGDTNAVRKLQPQGIISDERGWIGDAGAFDMADTVRGGCDGWQETSQRSKERGVAAKRFGFWSDHEWLTGADGKTRRAKPGVRMLVNGLSANLERLRAIEQEAWEEIVNYANSCGSDTDEAMRVLREAIPAQARREEQPVGMRFQLHETALLLDFLFCVDAARDRAANSRCVSEEVDEARGRIVRSMWAHGEAGRPSCERRPYEQLSGEPANPMLALSFVLARLAAAYREAARDANASAGRVGRLRGYGNAIVPPLAAEVIKAFMEVYSEPSRT